MDKNEYLLEERIKTIINNKQLEKGFSFFDSKNPETINIQKWFEKNQDGELLLQITRHIANEPYELSEWDKLSSKKRKEKAKKITRLCKELFHQLETFPKPERLLALSLADPDDADCILQNTFTGNCIPSKKSRDFSTIFTALAEHAEEMAQCIPKDKKPNTSEPEPRILARELADIFKRNDTSPDYNLIVAAINLRLPELNDPPGYEQVKGWLRKKGDSR